MIRITTTTGAQILTGQVTTCTVGGVAYLVHDGGRIPLTDVRRIEVVA